jgi:hypothetical protein
MAIIGLDLATTTGWALWKQGAPRPAWGTWKLPPDVDEVGRVMEKLRINLSDLHRLDPIEYLFFEAPILPGLTNIQTVYKLAAVAAMAEWWAYKVGAECRQVLQQNWRKHYTGRGTGKSKELKQAAITASKMRGWNVSNDHEADALGVLDYGIHCIGKTAPWRDAHLMGGVAAL